MDKICHISLFEGQAAAYIAHSTGIVQAAQSIHHTAPTATAALGRTLTGTALLAATLKGGADSLTVSIKGDGPIGAIVCVGYSNGEIKGYADHPLTDPARKPSGKLDVGAAVGSGGFLTVIKDMGMREPYIGRSALVSGEIAQDFAGYLWTSEQTASLVSLGVLCTPERTLGAGGILLQPLPGCSDEVLTQLEAHAARLGDISHAAADAQDAAALAAALLDGLPYMLLEERPISFACRCSRHRIEGVLLSLGEAELRDMIETDGKAQVHCQFCNRAYDFTREELTGLLEEGMAKGGEGLRQPAF